MRLLLNILYLISLTRFSVEGRFPEIKPTDDAKILSEEKKHWFKMSGDYLDRILKINKESKKSVAKNVVIMVGDGMGIHTVTATRIYKGQRDFKKSGEDHRLVFEDFPYVTLVKTYNVDMQVPDSAGTATALFTGVKVRYGSLGVDVNADKTSADQEKFEKSKIESIMTWAQQSNKDTGIITTTRITHATPAATYAHIPHRKWECNSEVPDEFKPFVKDIGRQLIEDSPGNGFKVILGGGYQQLGYITEDKSVGECVRTDGFNLTQVWIEKHKNDKAVFVTNNEQLSQVKKDTDYLLGLFYPNHLPLELIRDKGPQGTPSLIDMTKKGLDILKKKPNGFVLMIEGGRIDHGHHANRARVALEECSQFEKTIDYVVKETGPDTLIIVTADHSHAMTLNGYGKRGNDILGYGHFKPALTLTYGNGPGFKYHYSPNKTSILGPWIDPRTDENRLNDPLYQHMSTYYQKSETHGGEDVGIFAKGPGSHLFKGVIEQNYVAHVISYAACIGPRANQNPECKSKVRSAPSRGSQFIITKTGIISNSLLILLFIFKI